MMLRGIVYIATRQDRYIEEAFLSAESAKRQSPGLHITLFTDRPGNALCGLGLFDAVERIEGSRRGDPRANAQLNRIACLERSPYERTLYLDTDARVLTPAVAGLFEALGDHDVALVEDAPDTSDARTWSGLRMFNCGVILFRRTERTSALFRDWDVRTRRNLALARQTPLPAVSELAHIPDEAVRRQLLEIDKIALWGVLPPDAPQDVARVLTLDQSWNYRKDPNGRVVNILHLHDRVGLPAEEIHALAETWTKSGRDSEAQRVRAYLAERL